MNAIIIGKKPLFSELHQVKSTKKLVLVLTIFVLIVSNAKKILEQMPYIYYLVLFNDIKVQALLDLGSKINEMIFVFANKLAFLYK